MSDLITHVSDAAFEQEVVNSDLPVLVDFWAEWCGPCKAIAPALEDLAKEFEGKVRIAKVNVDQNQQTPAKYKVRGIPMLLLFKNGEPIAQQVGSAPKNALKSFIEKAVSA